MHTKTGDANYMKMINRGLILKTILERGMISRADVSKTIGLNKATVSVQVAELLAGGLVEETPLEHSGVGRRPIMLSINASAGYVLGLDLDDKKLLVNVSNLQGAVIHSEIISVPSTKYVDTKLLLLQTIRAFQSEYTDCLYGLVSVVIGIHGTVSNDGSILFVPKYNWRNVDLKKQLLEELSGIVLFVENNANLSSFAESVFHYPTSKNLLSITLTSGIGAGIMINGEIYKGHDGYAGEMGHMIIVPDGEPCSCGSMGCWERYASEPALIARLQRALDKPDLSFDTVKLLLIRQDAVAMQQFDIFIKYLSIGISNMINLHNPETIVLNSELLACYPDVISKIEKQLASSVSRHHLLTLSDLKYTACLRGACALAIQRFFNVPVLRLDSAYSTVVAKGRSVILHECP